MANSFIDSTLLDKALLFAVKAHANTERRGKGFPYIVHPLEAVSIVATLTSDQELLAAAALHDTVEDTDTTLDQLRAEFGERVAAIVEAESDKSSGKEDVKASWKERKQAAIDRLAAAPYDAKIVAMGDKLSNMRAIAADYRKIGDKLWERFHAPGGKADHEWHYRGLAASLSDLAGTDAYNEFTDYIEAVFGGPKPELIDMADYEESGDGFTAISYNHKDGKRMMKLYADFIPLENAERELQVSWSIRRMGIKIPEAYRLVTDGKRFGVEFQRITGKRSFARAISQEPDKLEYYSRLFARECKTLHSKPCDTKAFESVSEFFRGAVRDSKFFDDGQKEKMLAFIDTVPEAVTCLHGDMHIGNILTTGDEIYWIDLSDFRYGNPMYDFGMLYFVAKCQDDEMCDRLFHLNAAQMSEVWYYIIDEYFGPDADKAVIEEQVKPFTALYDVFLGSRVMYPQMKKFVEDILLK